MRSPDVFYEFDHLNLCHNPTADQAESGRWHERDDAKTTG